MANASVKTIKHWRIHWTDGPGSIQARDVAGTLEAVRQICADLPPGTAWVRVLTGAEIPHILPTSISETE